MSPSSTIPALVLLFVTGALHAQDQRCASQLLSMAHVHDEDAANLDLTVGPTIDRGGLLAITVVVHVVWNTPAENIPDVAIQSMIQRLNEDYQLLNPDAGFVRPVFAPDQSDAGIAFCLASVDPLGNASTGITRTFTTTTWFDPGTDPDGMKYPTQGIAAWDPLQYLNIWICDISSGAAPGTALRGYAYLPLAGIPGSPVDGVVLDHQLAFAPPGRTATHETGHYFGLLHPWGMIGACVDDDGMNDTPPTDSPTYTCTDPALIKCGALTQYENFMDLSVCPLLFTWDQRTAMRDVLQSVRAGLLTVTPCIPTHTPDQMRRSATCAALDGLITGDRFTLPSYLDGERIMVFDMLGRIHWDRAWTTGGTGIPSLGPGMWLVTTEGRSGRCSKRVAVPVR